MAARKGRRLSADLERFEQYTSPQSNGCIHWIGAISGNGYGTFWLEGRTWRAHRAAWKLRLGRIPTGKILRHRCDNPICVNLEHLKPGTQLENAKDAVERGRLNPWNRGLAKCKAGHELADRNIYFTPDGRRMCKKCRRRRSLEARYRSRGMTPAEARQHWINRTGGGLTYNWRGTTDAETKY